MGRLSSGGRFAEPPFSYPSSESNSIWECQSVLKETDTSSCFMYQQLSHPH